MVPAGRRPCVAAQHPDVDVRLDASYARDLPDSLRYGRFLVRPLDVAVQQRHMVLDHHMYMWQVEALLDRTEYRSDPVRQRAVVDVRVGMVTQEPVQRASQLPMGAQHSTGKRDQRGDDHDDRQQFEELSHLVIVPTSAGFEEESFASVRGPESPLYCKGSRFDCTGMPLMADRPTLAHGTGGAFRRVPLGTEELVIRFATPDDRDALAELFDSLSFDDRYLRFFSAFRPDDTFLERLAGANEHGARELIAVITAEGNDRRLVGEAGAWPLRNGNGELEITVAPGHRGWLGPYLLDAALEAAAEAGMPNVEADVMLSNREMLALLRSRGVAVVGHDGYISIRVVISTSGRVPDVGAEGRTPARSRRDP